MNDDMKAEGVEIDPMSASSQGTGEEVSEPSSADSTGSGNEYVITESGVLPKSEALEWDHQ